MNIIKCGILTNQSIKVNIIEYMLHYIISISKMDSDILEVSLYTYEIFKNCSQLLINNSKFQTCLDSNFES